jgi:hypothetical protein
MTREFELKVMTPAGARPEDLAINKRRAESGLPPINPGLALTPLQYKELLSENQFFKTLFTLFFGGRDNYDNLLPIYVVVDKPRKPVSSVKGVAALCSTPFFAKHVAEHYLLSAQRNGKLSKDAKIVEKTYKGFELKEYIGIKKPRQPETVNVAEGDFNMD